MISSPFGAFLYGADGDAKGPCPAVEILQPLAVQNTTACPLRAVTVYPVYRGRRMPAPRPPLGAEGGGMVQAVGLLGAGRSPLHFNKKIRPIYFVFCAATKVQKQNGRIFQGLGLDYPDRRCLAGYK